MNPPPPIGIIADDFTGAMDCGAQFPRCGLATALAIASLPSDPVVVLNTASREIPPEQARERCAEAAERLKGRRLFKKIDSTLRGPIAGELEGLLRAVGDRKIVVCPAAPRQGRTVNDGILWVNQVPLHESAFRSDPVFPAHTSAVAGRIGVTSAHLALAVVRGPRAELARRIATAPTPVVTVDALDEADLRRISEAILQADAVPCGALGLADAWAQALTGKLPESPPFSFPRGTGPVLIVNGSANPTTHAQVDPFNRRADCLLYRLMVPLRGADEALFFETMQSAWGDLRAVILSPGITETVREPAWLAFAHTAARLARAIIRWRAPACLVIAGGETANHLCGLLEVQSVQILGEAAPGIPFGRINGGAADGLVLVTKAGGFGAVDCLEKIVYG